MSTVRFSAALIASISLAVTLWAPAVTSATSVDADPCLTDPFSDVATTHPFCPEIQWMQVRGISTGFDDGTFRPAEPVTRQAMSAFMARLSGATLTSCVSTAPFTDVPVSHPFCKEVQWMKDEGISTGFGDGTYRPSIPITRQAMSAFLARFAGAKLASCSVVPFPDVPTTHPFCEEIAWMKEAGISTGFGDGTYRPELSVTRQAMSAFMYRAAQLPLDGFGWLSGTRDRVSPELEEPTPSLLTGIHLDFGDDPYDDPADRPLLTPGGVEILEAGGAGGGSSLFSEVFAFETLARLEGASLLKTEDEILYDTAGANADLLVTIDGQKVGVLVTRAVAYPPEDPYTESAATDLLTDRLADGNESSQNVASADAWVKQILVVMAYGQQHADEIGSAWAGLDSATKADTVVYLVVTDGSDTNLYSGA